MIPEQVFEKQHVSMATVWKPDQSTTKASDDGEDTNIPAGV